MRKRIGVGLGAWEFATFLAQEKLYGEAWKEWRQHPKIKKWLELEEEEDERRIAEIERSIEQGHGKYYTKTPLDRVRAHALPGSLHARAGQALL